MTFLINETSGPEPVTVNRILEELGAKRPLTLGLLGSLQLTFDDITRIEAETNGRIGHYSHPKPAAFDDGTSEGARGFYLSLIERVNVFGHVEDGEVIGATSIWAARDLEGPYTMLEPGETFTSLHTDEGIITVPELYVVAEGN